jgi:hypothetical protein
VALLRSYWNYRNRGNHGEQHQTIRQFQFTVQQYVLKWKDHLKKEAKPSTAAATHWKGLSPDFVKINVDASFHVLTNSGGWGAICRENVFDIQFKVARSIEMASDDFHAEAIALSNAVQIAEQLGVGRVVFETDCSNLHPAFISSDYDLAPIGAIISDLKYRMMLNFIEASVVFAPRICNKLIRVFCIIIFASYRTSF